MGKDEERLGKLVSRMGWRIDWAGEKERLSRLVRRMVIEDGLEDRLGRGKGEAWQIG